MMRFIGFLVLVVGALCAGAHPLDVWHWRNPLPQGNPLSALAYGKGLYVAVGGAGTILTSTDATNWVRRASGTSERLNSIVFARDQFVAVGNFGAIVTSDDGIVWNPQYAGTFFSLNGVAFGNTFVAVGANNTIVIEVDGWRSRASGPFSLTDVAYGNNTFVAVGSALLTSSDGANWFRHLSDVRLDAIAFGNGLFVAGGGGSFGPGNIWSSEDGLDWRMRKSIQGEIRGIACGAGKWVVATSEGIIYSSMNAINWIETHTNSVPMGGVGFGAGRFVAGLEDGTLLLSENATTWLNPLPEPLTVPYGWRDVTYGERGFAAVGPYSVVAHSSDGVWWTNSTGPNLEPFEELQSIAYGNGLYVAGETAGSLWVSADGNNWTNVVGPQFGVEVNDILYANGGFIAVAAYQGSVLTSSDGMQWNVRDLSPQESWDLQAVAFGDGMYVVAGRDRVGASGNTTNWHISEVGSEVNARGVAYGNGRFVVIGTGPVLVSTDGTNWSRTAHIISLQKVTFGAGHFVAVGGDYEFGPPESPVWSSEDGVTWTRRRIFTGHTLLGIAYGNGSFVTAGYPAGILQSDPFVALHLSMESTPNIILSGPVNRVYDLESSDESGEWRPMKTVLADSMPFAVSDTTATNAMRLYRARLR